MKIEEFNEIQKKAMLKDVVKEHYEWNNKTLREEVITFINENKNN